MLTLTADQASRLSQLYHDRARLAIARALGSAFPELPARAGERLHDLVAHAARTAEGYGITDAACVGRLLACWVAHGSGFEARPEFAWAKSILADGGRQQGAKAFQLCRRSAEQLPAKASQPGMVNRGEFDRALQVLDQALLPLGALGALAPGPRLRFGEPCDADGLELRLADVEWRREYRLQDGRWQRVPVLPQPDSWMMRVDAPERVTEGALPPQLTVLSRDQASAASVRVRLAAQQTCDGAMHPLLRYSDEMGVREWRGSAATTLTIPVAARPDPETPPYRPAPMIAVEDTPRYGALVVETCGVRASGLPLGRIEAWLAIHSARQHLLAWHREPSARRSWPLAHGEAAPEAPAARCRIERDGVEVPAQAWLAALARLDQQLDEKLEALVLVWERTSGVLQGRVHAEPRVMAGTGSAAWGWHDPEGVRAPPFMQAMGTLDLTACSLDLQLEGLLKLGSTEGLLRLSCPGVATLKAQWARDQAKLGWIDALKPVSLQFRLPFSAHYQPLAVADGSLASLAGPVQGALTGKCGLRLHADGPGLQWFCLLELEAVSVPVRVHDPLTGIEQRTLPLLEKTTLLDWRLG